MDDMNSFNQFRIECIGWNGYDHILQKIYIEIYCQFPRLISVPKELQNLTSRKIKSGKSDYEIQPEDGTTYSFFKVFPNTKVTQDIHIVAAAMSVLDDEKYTPRMRDVFQIKVYTDNKLLNDKWGLCQASDVYFSGICHKLLNYLSLRNVFKGNDMFEWRWRYWISMHENGRLASPKDYMRTSFTGISPKIDSDFCQTPFMWIEAIPDPKLLSKEDLPFDFSPETDSKFFGNKSEWMITFSKYMNAEIKQAGYRAILTLVELGGNIFRW